MKLINLFREQNKMKSLEFNEDTIISIDEELNKNIPYKSNPVIEYKDYIFERPLNIEVVKTDNGLVLQIINCNNKKFKECPFRKRCMESILYNSPWTVCPYHVENRTELKRKNSKSRKNADEFINLMKYFTNFYLFEYAVWIIQNLNTEVTKELFEIIKDIPELDPKYFKELFSSYAERPLTLKENEKLIRDQEKFNTYTTNDNMPLFIKSYLQMANDYLTNLNDFVSGVALGVVSNELADLRIQYKNKRILIPLFDFIIINVYKYDMPYSNRAELGEKYFINNDVLSIPKKDFNSFIEYARSNQKQYSLIFFLILERYEQKEHEKPLTEEEIEKIYFSS